MTTPLGLRERKKQALRTALSRTALMLMLDKGLDAVTPERVAEVVGVSARTFRNYFASPEEAIVEAVVHRVVTIPAALRDRPTGEPVWDTLNAVLPGAIAAALGDRDDVVSLLGTVRQNPGLRAQQSDAFDRIQRQFIEVIADRMGADADRDLTPRLLAAAGRAAMGAAVEVWALGHGRAGLADLVRDSLAQLRAGIPAGDA